MSFGLRALCVAGLLCLTGCPFGEVDVSMKSCPCADGYTCDTARDVCVRDGTVVDAAVDTTVPPDTAMPVPRETACDGALVGLDFCDGFEEPGFLMWDAEVVNMGSTRRVTDPRYRGQGAFEAVTPGSMGLALRSEGFVVNVGEELFFRTYAYLPSDLSVVAVSFFALTGMLGEMGDVILWGLGANGVATGFVGPAAMSIAASSPDLFPRDTWVCVQGHVSIEAGTATLDMAWDGEPVIEAIRLNTVASTPYMQFLAGLVQTDPLQGPSRMYFDELAVDKTTLPPCDP